MRFSRAGERLRSHAEDVAARELEGPRGRTSTLRAANERCGRILRRTDQKARLPKAPLVTCERLPWARHLWAAGIRAAHKAANEAIEDPKDRLPLDVVAYTMRHCAITDMLRAGIDVSSVGKIAGTSIAMINSHYAKFVQTDVREKWQTSPRSNTPR